MNLYSNTIMNTAKFMNRRRFLGQAAAAAGTAALCTQQANANPSSDSNAENSSWPVRFQPDATRPRWYPRDMPKAGEVVHEYKIEIDLIRHEILPMVETYAYAYNKMVPGPVFRVKEGDWIKVDFHNNTHDFHTIHWHGIEVPCEMDGVPLGTQYPVGYQQTFQYLFRAQPAGTHYYHCHNMTPLHVQAGMYGAFIVESDNDPVKAMFPYEREYTLALSEIDTNYVREQLNAMQQMGEVMDYMNGSPKLMEKMNGKMMGWFASREDFVQAVKNGYIPPYAQSMSGYVRPIQPNFFMINGKSYPMTDHLHIRSGENIRVRLIGAGMMPHFMHLHGHDFWHVCQDGAVLASPIRHNTIPVYPGCTTDIVIQGTNPGCWHFHDHSDISNMNNGVSPGGMMTMLMYDDAEQAGFHFKEIIAVNT